MKKFMLVLLLVSGFANAAETLRLFPIYPNTIGNVVGDLGIDLPNTDIALIPYRSMYFSRVASCSLVDLR